MITFYTAYICWHLQYLLYDKPPKFMNEINQTTQPVPLDTSAIRLSHTLTSGCSNLAAAAKNIDSKSKYSWEIYVFYFQLNSVNLMNAMKQLSGARNNIGQIWWETNVGLNSDTFITILFWLQFLSSKIDIWRIHNYKLRISCCRQPTVIWCKVVWQSEIPRLRSRARVILI